MPVDLHGQHPDDRRIEAAPFANAYWVAPGLLLAGPYPGDTDPEVAETKIEGLVAEGIKAVINLQPSNEVGRGGATFPDLGQRLAKHGIACLRMPIYDMGIPSRNEMISILDAIDGQNAIGNAVYIHCWGGHGRTGTVVGCWLQRHGLGGPEGPLTHLKDLRALAGIQEPSPQTVHQRKLVTTWQSPDAVPVTNRLAGGVWGALVGDALGVPYEFGPACAPNAVVWGAKGGLHRQPPGTWSDDGGLLLALLDSLAVRGFDPVDQGRRSVAWLDGTDYKPGAVFDVGNTTRRALSKIRAGTPAESAGGHSEGDNGNGSLMRILPIALFASRDTAELIERAERSSAITHAHPRSRIVCALYCLVAARLLSGELDRQAALRSAIRELEGHLGQRPRNELDLILGFSEPRGSGYVVDTFWSAWTAFESTTSYADCVRKAVSYGGDTDTTACVAGGLAGIYWGVSGIPGEWLKAMRGRGVVTEILSRFVEGRATSFG